MVAWNTNPWSTPVSQATNQNMNETGNVDGFSPANPPPGYVWDPNQQKYVKAGGSFETGFTNEPAGGTDPSMANENRPPQPTDNTGSNPMPSDGTWAPAVPGGNQDGTMGPTAQVGGTSSGPTGPNGGPDVSGVAGIDNSTSQADRKSAQVAAQTAIDKAAGKSESPGNWVNKENLPARYSSSPLQSGYIMNPGTGQYEAANDKYAPDLPGSTESWFGKGLAEQFTAMQQKWNSGDFNHMGLQRAFWLRHGAVIDSNTGAIYWDPSREGQKGGYSGAMPAKPGTPAGQINMGIPGQNGTGGAAGGTGTGGTGTGGVGGTGTGGTGTGGSTGGVGGAAGGTTGGLGGGNEDPRTANVYGLRPGESMQQWEQRIFQQGQADYGAPSANPYIQDNPMANSPYNNWLQQRYGDSMGSNIISKMLLQGTDPNQSGDVANQVQGAIQGNNYGPANLQGGNQQLSQINQLMQQYVGGNTGGMNANQKTLLAQLNSDPSMALQMIRGSIGPSLGGWGTGALLNGRLNDIYSQYNNDQAAYKDTPFFQMAMSGLGIA